MSPEPRATPSMPRVRLLAAVALSLAGLVVVGRLAIDAWLLRPVPDRVRIVPREPTPTPKPLLLAIVDGLRAEAVVDDGGDPAMPFWISLAGEGASGIGVTGEPTMTACCVRAILSGRNPDLYAAFANFDAKPVEGTVTQFLVERGLRAAHAGDAAAWQLSKRHYRKDDVLAFPDRGPRDQGTTDDLSLPFALGKANDPAISVLTFHLVRPDHAGHKFGATGKEYRDACATVDGQLAQVVRAFRALRPDATVLLTADHGVTPRGTHGGGEPGARRAPFALAGPRVAKRRNVEIPQAALAPTLCAVLVLPMPPLAESPPALELTTLSPAERVDALDNYVRARIGVARDVGATEAASAADTKRRAAFSEGPTAAVGRLAAVVSDLDERVFGASGRVPAVLAVLLSLAWLASLVRVGGPGLPRWSVFALVPAAAWLVAFFAGEATRAWVAAPAVGVAAIAISTIAYARPSGLAVSGTRTFCLGGLVAVPAIGGAGLLLQHAFDATESASPAALRTAAVAALLVVAALLLATRARVRSDVRSTLDARPALIAALGGGLLGFGLSLRLFVDPFVHTPILFAAAAGAGVAAVVLSRRAREEAPRARWAVLAVAVALLAGGRVLEGAIPEWVFSSHAVGAGWLVAAALALVPIAAAARRVVPSGADGAALALAALCVGAVTAFRLGDGGAGFTYQTARAAGVVALAASPFARDADVRLVARLVACVGLAALFDERSDAQVLVFALFAVGALAAARLPAPTTRAGLAWLAILVLAVRIAMFHALGYTESMGTIGVGAGVLPKAVLAPVADAVRGAAAIAAGAAGGSAASTVAPVAAGGWTPEMIQNAFNLALKFSLVWVVLFAVVARVCDRARVEHGLRVVGADLAVSFAARGAMIVLGMTVWWRSSWWVTVAKDVFTLGAADLVLVLGALAAAGAFRRSPAGAAAPGSSSAESRVAVAARS